MKRKRTYQTVDVESFDVLTVLQLLTVGCVIAIDVAKTKFVAALATAAGEVVKLLRFEHPRQTATFLRVVEALRDAKLEPHVVMEPTGTYGDALRYQLHQREVPVHMMSPKYTHDFAEVLDGVPSMHDPKAAVALARLHAIRPATPWKPPSEGERDLRALLDERSLLSRTQALFHGHVEGMLARHWPEFWAVVDIYGQRSWMTLLTELPGPQAVASSPEQAATTLRRASRGGLKKEQIAAIVDAAKVTCGVPMTNGEQAKLVMLVEHLEQQTRRTDAVDATLAKLVEADPMAARMAVAVGPACAAAIVAHIGSPVAFANAGALEKALGLNMKERSSGNKKGRLHITKRGSAQVRQLMYLAALRLIKRDRIAGAWYRARGAYREGRKVAAVVAVMRKLARALFHVARGAAFDATKLFDVRRLDLTLTTTNTKEAGDAGVSEALSGRRSMPLRRQPEQGGVSQSSA
jgi:transposase